MMSCQNINYMFQHMGKFTFSRGEQLICLYESLVVVCVFLGLLCPLLTEITFPKCIRCTPAYLTGVTVRTWTEIVA